MAHAETRNKQQSDDSKRVERIHFIASPVLVKKIKAYTHTHHVSKSDLIRRAVQYYLETEEASKRDRDLKEGYQANYHYYLQTNNDWEVVVTD